jgi:hypothetical protein
MERERKLGKRDEERMEREWVGLRTACENGANRGFLRF